MKNSIFNKRYNIQDQIQVRAMCQWAADLELKDELGKLFNTPRGLDRNQIKTCLEYEGWILGSL